MRGNPNQLIPEYIKRLNRAEREEIITQQGVVGQSLWVALKSYLSLKEVRNSIRVSNNSSRDVFSSRGVFFILWSCFSLLRHVIIRKKGSNLVFTSSAGIYHEEGQVFDVFIPDEVDDCIPFINVANPKFMMKNKAFLIKSNGVLDNYSVGLISILFSKILQVMVRARLFKPEFMDEIELVKDKLALFGFNITKAELLSIYLRLYTDYYVYKALFNLLKPDTIYIVSANTKSGICAAARSYGCSLIEMQHGLVGEVHPGYNYSRDLRNGRFSLPTPDVVYVYDDFWRKELLDAGYYQNDEIRIVGNKKYRSIRKDDAKHARILFTGQSSFNDEVTQFLTELVKLVTEGQLGLAVEYRPHPKDTAADHIELVLLARRYSCFSVNESRKVSTEKLISNSTSHVSIFSACHFDSVSILGKTYVLTVPSLHTMDYYISKYGDELFIPVDCAKELLVKMNYFEGG